MSLPSVIKLKGYKLIRNDSFDEVLYSLVLESTARSLSSAITNCVNRAKSLETQLREKYGLIYYGFEVLTQVKEDKRWRVVVKIDYVAEDVIDGEDECEQESVIEENVVKLKVKDTTFIDYLVILNVIDELEMILMKPPSIKDVADMASQLGVRSPYSKLRELQNKGLVNVRDGHVKRA